MAAITWKNINAPDFRGVAQMQQAAGDSFANALQGLENIGQGQKDLIDANYATTKGANTQLAEESLIEQTPDLKALEALNFTDFANQYQGQPIDRASLFDIYQGRAGELNQSALDALQMDETKAGIEAKEAATAASNARTKASGLEAKALELETTENNLLKKVAEDTLDMRSNMELTDEDIKQELMVAYGEGPNAYLLPRILKTMDDTLVSREGFTTQQRNQFDALEAGNQAQFDKELAELDTEYAAIKAQMPTLDEVSANLQIDMSAEPTQTINKLTKDNSWLSEDVKTNNRKFNEAVTEAEEQYRVEQYDQLKIAYKQEQQALKDAGKKVDSKKLWADKYEPKRKQIEKFKMSSEGKNLFLGLQAADIEEGELFFGSPEEMVEGLLSAEAKIGSYRSNASKRVDADKQYQERLKKSKLAKQQRSTANKDIVKW